MIDKDILINDLEMEFAKANAKYLENDEDPFYGGICSALKDVIRLVRQQREQFEWINADIVPVTDKYILLSFDNFSSVEIGRYEEDEDGGGAYYLGDEDETCSQMDIFVNAWMELPEPYGTETEPTINMNDIKLPCKIGDMVRVDENVYKVSRIVIEEYATTFFTTDKNGNIGYGFCDDDIGKTVFIEVEGKHGTGKELDERRN